MQKAKVRREKERNTSEEVYKEKAERRERSCEMWYDHYIVPLQMEDDDFLSSPFFFLFSFLFLSLLLIVFTSLISN